MSNYIFYLNVLITQNSQNLIHNHNVASHTHTLGGNTGDAGSHSHSTNSTKNSAGTSDKNLTGTYKFAPDTATLYQNSGCVTGIFSTNSVGSLAYRLQVQGHSGTAYYLGIDATHSHTTNSVENHKHSLPSNTGGCTAFNTGDSGSSTESRPVDFTYKVWKRTA